MKKKIGTILEEDIFVEAKTRAACERRPLSELFEEAIADYLHRGGPRGDAEHACKLFCSHRGRLELDEINELFEEDALAI